MDLLYCGSKVVNMTFVTDIDYVSDDDIRFNLSTGSNDFIQLTGNDARAAYEELKNYFNNKGRFSKKRKSTPTPIRTNTCAYYGSKYIYLDAKENNLNNSHTGCAIDLTWKGVTVRRNIVSYNAHIREAELDEALPFKKDLIKYKIFPKRDIL